MRTSTAFIVGIGGTPRHGSSTERAVRHVLARAEEQGARTVCFPGDELVALPMYDPEQEERTDLARRMITAIREADGVVIGSPGYHGSVSGLVKNALDYIEDTREDPRPYLSGLPVGCVATGAGWQGVVATLQALRSITHALRGWPTPMGAGLNTTEQVFDDEGRLIDERAGFQLRTVAEELLSFIGGAADPPGAA